MLSLFLIVGQNILAGPIEDTFGAGARNKAMAGTGVSTAEDFTATYYNPSLLAQCRGSRLSIGYDYIHTGLNPENADQLDNYSAINMGFCLKPLNQVGIGLYSNFSVGPIEFATSTQDDEAKFIMYGGDLKAFSMMMGTGYQPFKWISIGAAMSMATGVTLGTELNVNTAALGRKPPIVAKFPAQISPIVGAIIGVDAIPLEHWHLSMVYRSETFGKINIETAGILNGIALNKTTIEGFISYSPHQLAFSTSYLFHKAWLFTADTTIYFWQNYPGPFLQIRTTDDSNIMPGITIAGVGNPHFTNIAVPRFAVEYNPWNTLKVRAGYAFRPTPAPKPSSTGPQLLDASAHRISFGAGYEMQVYQNIFLTADAFFAADILQDGRGSAINTGFLLGAEYD